VWASIAFAARPRYRLRREAIAPTPAPIVIASDDEQASALVPNSRLLSAGAGARPTGARGSGQDRSSYAAAVVSWPSPAVLSAASRRCASASMSLANWVTASRAPSSPQPAT
jgi:hypothetical protein